MVDVLDGQGGRSCAGTGHDEFVRMRLSFDEFNYWMRHEAGGFFGPVTCSSEWAGRSERLKTGTCCAGISFRVIIVDRLQSSGFVLDTDYFVRAYADRERKQRDGTV